VGSSWRFGLVVERRSRKAKITGSIPVSAFFFPHAIYFSFSRIFSNYPFSLCLFIPSYFSFAYGGFEGRPSMQGRGVRRIVRHGPHCRCRRILPVAPPTGFPRRGMLPPPPAIPVPTSIRNSITLSRRSSIHIRGQQSGVPQAKTRTPLALSSTYLAQQALVTD
jgi:hypothetical protein